VSFGNILCKVSQIFFLTKGPGAFVEFVPCCLVSGKDAYANVATSTAVGIIVEGAVCRGVVSGQTRQARGYYIDSVTIGDIRLPDIRP
jgi:hypothetical protein